VLTAGHATTQLIRNSKCGSPSSLLCILQLYDCCRCRCCCSCWYCYCCCCCCLEASEVNPPVNEKKAKQASTPARKELKGKVPTNSM
jgi:hypothetical protein